MMLKALIIVAELITFNHNTTNIFHQNLEALLDPSIHTIVNEGGSSSSKTYSVIQLLSYFASKIKIPHLISICSESFPHLEAGAIRDFKEIWAPLWDDDYWNESKHFYDYGNGSILEFFAADKPGKAHGPRRNVLYCNEVNNIPKSIVDAMMLRTKGKAIYDFNPVCEFWVHNLRGKPGVKWIHSTYQDSKMFLPRTTIERIENLKETDPNGWNVYGLGLVGNVEGLVHSRFSQDDIPEGKGKVFYGLDFGYTNDPTALVKCVLLGDDLYCDELIYETGLNNQQIAKRFETLGLKKNETEIFADSSEPKSIDEIHLCGWNIKPAPKGPDSIINGVQRVNQFRQHWTKQSLNAIREMRNYRYLQDKNGKYLNAPRDDFNHAMDARRYAVVGKGLDRPLQIF
jgi:phage terminase large subunit